MRNGCDEPQIAHSRLLSGRDPAYVGAELDYHRSVFDEIGRIAGDTQSMTVESLGSYADRAKITPIGR